MIYIWTVGLQGIRDVLQIRPAENDGSFNIEGVNGKTANVCTGWIRKNGEERLTLTSLYVTKKKGDKR